MKKNIFLTLLSFILIMFIILSCPLTGEEKPDKPVNNKLPAPENVEANSENPDLLKEITVSWDTVEEADYYIVYKKNGNGDYELIEDSNVNGTNFTFNESSYSQNIVYSVRAFQNTIQSGLSRSSNVITLTIEDVMKAIKPDVKSFMKDSESNAGIKIEWEADPNANGYKLYRSSDPDGSYSEIFTIAADQERSFFDHENLTAGNFYYYKLCYYKDGADYEMSDYSFGVKGNKEADIFEPNDIKSESQKLILDNYNYANIFYFKDSYNNLLIDYDWYYITVPAGETKSVFFYNIDNNPIGYLQIEIEGENPIDILNDDEFEFHNKTAGEIDMYFKISVKLPEYNNKFTNYEMYVSQ